MYLKWKKEDRELNMFITTLARVGSWFYYGAPFSKRAIFRVLFFVFEFTSIVGNAAMFKVGLKRLYISSSAGLYLITTFYVHWTFVVFAKNEKYLNEYATRMRNILKKRDSDWEVKIFDETCYLPWRLIVIYHNMILVFIVSVVTPFIYDTFLYITGIDSEPLSQCNYFEVYLEDSKKIDLMFIITSFLTLCVALIGGCKHYTLLCIAIATVTYLNAELRILSKHFELWSQDKRKPNREMDLRRLIQEHNEILDLIRLMKKYLGEFYLAQYTVVPLTITLCLFTISQAMKIGDTDTIIRVSYTMTGFLINLFLTCLFGQALYDETERFSDCLYFLPWYEESVRVRKDLYTMMLASSKPIMIDFKGILSINLLLFKDIMNASYSYFTILQTFV